jgi:hypothetical protein
VLQPVNKAYETRIFRPDRVKMQGRLDQWTKIVRQVNG